MVQKHGFDEARAKSMFASELIAYAEKTGAVPVPTRFSTTPSIKEVMGDRKIKFFPELPRIEWEKLLNQMFIIESCKIVPEFTGKFGVSTFPLLKILLEDGRRCTTLGSGKAILNQVKNLNDKRLFPVKVTLIMYSPEDGGDPYYLLS
jgi:hypothetical protein